MIIDSPLSTGAPAGAFLDHPAFSALDVQFARLLGRLAKARVEEAMLAGALASRAAAAGHICIRIDEPDLERLLPGDDLPDRALTLPTPAAWREALQASGVTGKPGEFRPLILDDDGRLYLHRLWAHEDALARAILRRAAEPTAPLPNEVNAVLDRYLPPDAADPDQRHAVITALTHRFCVITGGPGTGKTRTVGVLLAVLIETAGDKPPRMALAAPTGRAANRIDETLQEAKRSLSMPEAVAARLPSGAQTIHRLLGHIPGTSSFRHDATSPLPHEVIIVDEASMVDLALMSKLFVACRPDARIILVGDKDQLASVQAGAVLGDICEGASRRAPAPAPDELPLAPVAAPGANSASVSPGSSLQGGIVILTKNHRIRDEPALAALGDAVNAGRSAAALACLRLAPADGPGPRESATRGRRASASGVIGRALPADDGLMSALRGPVLDQFTAVCNAPDPLAALELLGRFRILCALRRGPHGSARFNRLATRALIEAGLIPGSARFYPGRPVLILRNDYRLRLYNGDLGVVLPDASGQLRVWFLEPGGGLRDLSPARLPEHETAFAMTVHKSQGSEFDEVLLILPRRDSPVLTRELVYTGLTRARRRLEIWLDPAVFRAAVERKARRTSGLAARLWNAPRITEPSAGLQPAARPAGAG